MSGASSNPERPNILLVVMDTARADHFGPWGGRAHTPVFDAMASRGVAVQHARSAAPWTVPSHASLFSGLPPFEHDVIRVAADANPRILSLGGAIARIADRWLPVSMQSAGYRTFGVSANVWITPQLGFDLGFDAFHSVGPAKIKSSTVSPGRRPRAQRVPTPVRRTSKRLIRAGITNPLRRVEDARKGRDFGSLEALERLAAEATRSDAPFFGFVNIIEPHTPYLPPGTFNPLHGFKRLKGPIVVGRYLMGARGVAYNAGAVDIPEDAMAIIRELYAGEIAYTDRFLGKMLEVLESNGVLDDTLIVVTSDHGENLGEDHLVGHQASLDDRLLDVPLVFMGPGTPDVAAGAKVFPMTGVPWVLGQAAGLTGPWEPPGPVAVAQLRWGTISPKLQAAADRFHLTEHQRARLRRSIEQATDGVTTVTVDSMGLKQVVGPASGAPALHRAIEDARGRGREPAEDELSVTPGERAEIESRLSDLGYI
jgi:arylsulfatase A-like enzyme